MCRLRGRMMRGGARGLGWRLLLALLVLGAGASIALAQGPAVPVPLPGSSGVSGVSDPLLGLVEVRDVLAWYLALLLYDATIGGGSRLTDVLRRRRGAVRDAGEGGQS